MKLLTLNVHAWLEANQAEKIEILFFGAIRILVTINMMRALRF